MGLSSKIYSKIRHRSGYALNDLRGILGLNKPLFRETPGARILVYHGICQSDHTRFNSLFQPLKTFEKHLQFYRKYFQIVSLDAYFKQQFSKDRFAVCITFDDGFANNYKYVLPLMNKYQAPVSFFITGIREAGYDFLWNDYLSILQRSGPGEIQFENESFCKDRHRQYVSNTTGKTLRNMLQATGFDKKAGMINSLKPVMSLPDKAHEDFWMQMTREEIRTLSASPLATIGCHGYYHNDLAKIPLSDARDEIIRNKQYLENITQKEINSIAFPYGSYTRSLVDETTSIGFDRLLAVDFPFPEDYSDPALRERLTVNPYISLNNQMSAIVNGRYA